jgi:hypothetical protein
MDRNIGVASKHIKIYQIWENKMKQNVCLVVGKIYVKGMALSDGPICKIKRGNTDFNKKKHDYFHEMEVHVLLSVCLKLHLW